MSTQTLKRLIAMMLVCIMTFTMLPMGVLAEEPAVADEQVAAMMDLEQPAEEPAEEPAAEPTEAEKLMAKIDNMLLRYLGDRFKGGDKTNEEIVAEVNKLSRSEIGAIVDGLADTRFERLVAEVANMKDAINDLTTAADRAACNGRGVFAALCDATAERTNSRESAALIDARETILGVNAYCGNADLMSMSAEQLQSVISAINTMVMKIEYLDAVDRPAIEAQYGATIDALSDVLYAAEARLTELDALMAFRAEVELFGMKYNVMADPEILAEGMKYWELLDCKAEIKALENTINALNPADVAQYGHLLTFIADLKAAAQARIDDLAPKLHSDSLRRDLLPLLEEAREIYCLPYTEEDLWIKLETKVALIARGEDPAGDFAKIERIITTYEQLMDNHKAQIDEEYGAEIVFLTELYADLAELAATPLDMQTRGESWFDPAVSGNYFNIISDKQYGLVSGAREAEIVLNNMDGTDRKVVHVLQIDTKNPDVTIVPGYNGIDKFIEDPTNQANFSTAGVSTMAKYYENELGYNIIGGMNTSLAYDIAAPYSFLMYEGVVLQDKNLSYKTVTDAQWKLADGFYNEDGTVNEEALNEHSGKCDTYLAIKKDGTCELRSHTEKFEADDWTVISANFGWCVKDGKNTVATTERTSSDAARSMIGIKADGTLVLCMTDGRGANNSTGLSNYELGEMMLSLGCVNAVNCDGGGSSSFITKREGDANFAIRCVPCDGAERATIHSIFVVNNAVPSGIFDHANVESDYVYYAPYTTSTFEAEAVDTKGFGMEMPETVTWALSDESFGTIEEGVFVSNGKLGDVDIQVINAETVVGFKTIHVVNPKQVKFAQAESASPFGRTISLELDVRAEVIAADQEVNYAGDYDVFFQADSFDFVLEPAAAATLNGLELTATTDETVKGVKVSATYKHADMGSTEMWVGFGKETEVKWTFEDGDVSNWMGTSAVRAWLRENGITECANLFEGGNFSDNVDSRTFLATKENGQVKNGDYALGVEIDFRTGDNGDWCYNMFFNVEGQTVLRDTANNQNATTLAMWVYIPEGATGIAMQTQLYGGSSADKVGSYQSHVSFHCPDGTTKTLNAMTEADVPDSRWMYGTVNLAGYNYVSLQNPEKQIWREPCFIRFYTQSAPHYNNYVFYYDDISLDYSPVTPDRDAPVISDPGYAPADEVKALTDGAVLTGVTSAGFSATVADVQNNLAVGLNTETGKIYLDGVEIASQVIGSTLSTVEAVALDNGAHVVTFEIADKANNVTQLSVSFTVGEGNALVYVAGHNDNGNKPEYDSVYYVDLKTDKVEDVKLVEANIRLNTANNWELDNMIVAPGFVVVEYEVLGSERGYITTYARGDVHSVENVAHVVLEKTDSTLTGSCTLVSLPVRVWSWNEEISGKTADEQFASGYCPVVTIDYDVRYGYVENTNGEVSTFNGSDSVETMLNDTVNPWHKHKAVALEDKAATCTENGYTGRTYCEGCGSVVEWGEVVPVTGHSYSIVDGRHICDVCDVDMNITGLYEVNHKFYYAINGKLSTGWKYDNDGNVYYMGSDYASVSGTVEIDGHVYTFVDFRLYDAAWETDENGTMCYWAGKKLATQWFELNGNRYYFLYSGYMAEDYTAVNGKLYHFGEGGALVGQVTGEGIVKGYGKVFYLENDLPVFKGLIYDESEEAYYYIPSTFEAVTNVTRLVPAAKTNGLLPEGTYTFGLDGKMLNVPVIEVKDGLVEENGKLMYYEDGVLVHKGLVEIDGAIYYINSSCYAVTNVTRLVPASWTNGILPEGTYTFGPDGKYTPDSEPEQPEVKNGLVEENDKLMYYENGVLVHKGLVEIDGAIYYINSSYYAVTNVTRLVPAAWANDILPEGIYTFGPDGKLVIDK